MAPIGIGIVPRASPCRPQQKRAGRFGSQGGYCGYNQRMSDDEAIAAYLQKADESLAGAESEFAVGRYNNCANRAYYACFQAAIAALIRVGIGPSGRDLQWRHDAVQAQFAEQLINRRKRYPAAMRTTLESGAALRATADYGIRQVGAIKAQRTLRQSRDFVESVRRGEPR